MRLYTIHRIGKTVCTFGNKFKGRKKVMQAIELNKKVMSEDWLSMEEPDKVVYALS